MEDLISYTYPLPATSQISLIEAKQSDIGRLLRKVKVKLSASQYKALHTVLTFWLHKAPAKGELYEEAYYLSVYKLFIAKVQKAPLNVLKAKVKLSLDLCQAQNLMEALTDYQFDNASYEMNVVNYIIQEIDKQTV
jgi:hypothetical protein